MHIFKYSRIRKIRQIIIRWIQYKNLSITWNILQQRYTESMINDYISKYFVGSIETMCFFGFLDESICVLGMIGVQSYRSFFSGNFYRCILVWKWLLQCTRNAIGPVYSDYILCFAFSLEYKRHIKWQLQIFMQFARFNLCIVIRKYILVQYLSIFPTNACGWTKEWTDRNHVEQNRL